MSVENGVVIASSRKDYELQSWNEQGEITQVEGILGPIIPIGGLYMFMMNNSVVAIPLVLIGAVMVIALILNEVYRK